MKIDYTEGEWSPASLAQHLIFDFDETLFTLHLPWELYYKPIYVECLRLDRSLAQFKYQHISELENEAVRRLGADFQAWVRRRSQEFESRRLEGVTEHKQITDWIRQESGDRQIYLWTSNMLSTVAPILTKAGLIGRFASLITKDTVQFLKPDPEGFFHLFDPLTQNRSDYLFVGDSDPDQIAAQEAGIEFQRFEAKNTA